MSPVGSYHTNKQWAVVEFAINRKKYVQTIEVKDFMTVEGTKYVQTIEVKDFMTVEGTLIKFSNRFCVHRSLPNWH